MKYVFILCFTYFAMAFAFHVISDTSLLISNFLDRKDLNFGVFFICWKRIDVIQLHKLVDNANMRTVYLTQSVLFKDKSKYLNYSDVHTSVGYVLDLSCEDAMSILMQADKLNSFRNFFKWLIISKSEASPNEIFAKLKIRTDSDITFVPVLNTSNKKIDLYDVYNLGFGLGGSVNYTKMGFYQKGKTHITNLLSRYEQRKDLTSINLRVGTVITQNLTVPPVEYLQDRRHPNYDSISKLNFNLFNHVRWYHNFSQNLIVVDKWFGKTLPGTDGGSLAQLLYEQKLDYSCCGAILKPHRVDNIDFLAPTYNFRTCFIFRNPGSSGAVQNEFLKPFHISVWYTLLFSAVVIVFILRMIYWAEENILDSWQENSWVNSVLIILAAFTQQGSSLLPAYFAGRVVVLFLLIMSLIIYNYYTSSIVSSLLSSDAPPWKTLDELARSTLRVGAENIIYVKILFEISTDPDIQNLYKTKGSIKPFYYTPEEGIALVKKGGFAFNTEPSTGYPIVTKTFEPHEICELNEINLYRPSPLYTMVPKKNQYNEFFAVTYMKLLASGIIHREKSIWQARKPKCLANVMISAVTINQTSALLIFLCVGIISAFCVLILEISFYRAAHHKAFDQIIRFARKYIGRCHVKKVNKKNKTISKSIKTIENILANYKLTNTSKK